MKNTSISPITKPSTGAFREPLSEVKVAVKEIHTNSTKESSFDVLYLKKDYKGAAQYLLKNNKQIDSGIFHYNLGTVYSKMGDQATARFHLEKAIQDGYINSSSLNNLAYVKSQLQVDDLTNSTSLPDELVSISTSIPSAGYLSISLALIVLFIVLIRFKKIEKKLVIALVLLVSLTPILFSNFYVKNINFAIALQDIPLYEGPSKIFNQKGKVRAGSKVIIGHLKDGWFQVEFPVSLSGWVNKDQLGIY
jgi:tetratricopeptide (TPR) repeat protein